MIIKVTVPTVFKWFLCLQHAVIIATVLFCFALFYMPPVWTARVGGWGVVCVPQPPFLQHCIVFWGAVVFRATAWWYTIRYYRTDSWRVVYLCTHTGNFVPLWGWSARSHLSVSLYQVPFLRRGSFSAYHKSSRSSIPPFRMGLCTKFCVPSWMLVPLVIVIKITNGQHEPNQ